MCRFTPRIRPRRRDTTSTLAPAVFRARSGTISSTFSKPSAARAAIVRPLSRRLVGMSSPCRSMAHRWRNSPWQRKPRSGRHRAVHTWLAAPRRAGYPHPTAGHVPGRTEARPARCLAGPPGLTAGDDGHDLRHRPSTLLLVDGVPVKAVSGHGVVRVDVVDAGGGDVEHLLPVSGDRFGQVDDVEDLGAAEASGSH